MEIMSEPLDVCQVLYVDEERIGRAKKKMKPEKILSQLAETFKVLGDTTRVRILHALSVEELCVCDIAALIATSQSAVSHQLRLLRAAKLVKFRREGKMVYYSVDDDHVARLFDEGIRHVEEG
jgi:ArsR family transcriptional regulator, lead/cadmium/zinc/bismuth-responsive transcriptional repressor